MGLRISGKTRMKIAIWGLKMTVPILVTLMFIVGGSLTTILLKFQNECYSKGIGFSAPQLFAHPFTQIFQMYIGMMFVCLPLFWLRFVLRSCFSKIVRRIPMFANLGKSKKNRSSKYEDLRIINEDTEGEEETTFLDSTTDNVYEKETNGTPGISDQRSTNNALIFIIPSICDVVASTLVSLALIFGFVSIYTMVRTIQIVFTGILSSIFLKSPVWKLPHAWLGSAMITFGSFIVLYSSIAIEGHGPATARNPALAGIMIVSSQFIYSIQYVIEELLLKGYNAHTLEVPGYEGLWGSIISMFILFVLYFIPGSDYGSGESFPSAFFQFASNPMLTLWSLLFICNIGLYNFAGNLITKYLSATARVALDTLRIIIPWLVQTALGRQEFTYLQAIGFCFLVGGTSIFNEVGFDLICPCYVDAMKRWEKLSCQVNLKLSEEGDVNSDKKNIRRKMMNVEEYGEEKQTEFFTNEIEEEIVGY